MLALLEAFFHILTRRRGPEDLPDSAFLLNLLLVVYVACQLPVAIVMYGWTGTTALVILADVLLMCGFFWVVLRVTGHAGRLRQTLCALLGTGAILAVVQAPLVALSRAAPDPASRPAILTAALLALLVWMVVVQSHITARALSRPLPVGVAIAIVYFVLSFQLSTRIAPEGPS